MDSDWEYETEAINQNSTVSGGTSGSATSSGAHASAFATLTENEVDEPVTTDQNDLHHFAQPPTQHHHQLQLMKITQPQVTQYVVPVKMNQFQRIVGGALTRDGRGHVAPPSRGIGCVRGFPGRGKHYKWYKKLALWLLSQCMLNTQKIYAKETNSNCSFRMPFIFYLFSRRVSSGSRFKNKEKQASLFMYLFFLIFGIQIHSFYKYNMIFNLFDGFILSIFSMNLPQKESL